MVGLYRLLCLAYLVQVVAFARVVRLCKDTEIEVLSGQGVRIEAHNNSRAEIALWDRSPNNNPTFELDFEFKTRSSHGILLYGKVKGQQKEMVALYLVKGFIHYKIYCPLMDAEIYIPTKTKRPLDDGKWHKVTYTAQFRNHAFKSLVTVDGFLKLGKHIGVSCEPLTTLEMGGHSINDAGHDSQLQHLAGQFEGCIRKLNISKPLRSPPKYYFVSSC
ncbi:neurexin-1-like [Physella acuta]|uniref:neurexin-1-like n=1 Tax=Physella acuta TaxID=109671 RepID=UPI0027DE3342|nr:neurexin-1-like [Physella acuta]